ncbi:hypothetical protein BVRB_5g112340 [Beta vulgaris subsp. vulgaris]|nr:hypothetical protein BVRB_5g112340 [Beta vulgaris subsp. vulgaris]
MLEGFKCRLRFLIPPALLHCVVIAAAIVLQVVMNFWRCCFVFSLSLCFIKGDIFGSGISCYSVDRDSKLTPWLSQLLNRWLSWWFAILPSLMLLFACSATRSCCSHECGGCLLPAVVLLHPIFRI